MCVSDYFKQTCIYEGCGITWYYPTGFDNQRRKNHKTFYCPNGHGQVYNAQSSEDILRKRIHTLEQNEVWLEGERDRYQKCAEHKKHQINGLRGFIKRNRKEGP